MRQIVTNNKTRHFNPFNPDQGSVVISNDEVNEAVVVDIIVNDEHPEYSGGDGYNVGAIKFRLIKTNYYKDDGSLSWAFPIDSNITEYPLIGELVTIVPALNRFYYNKKINVSNKITTQAFSRLNDELKASIPSTTKSSTLESSTAVPNKTPAQAVSLGKTFQEPKDIFRLKNFEGDIVFEGRTGASIRFGNSYKTAKIFQSSESDQSPNILLRAGQSSKVTPTTNTQFGLVLEDINFDASSIWMVSDQIIPIELSTAQNKAVHGKSVKDFPNIFDKAQIVINSDRIVLNSKIDKILLHSNNGIHLTSTKDVTIDTATNYVSYIGADRKIEIRGGNTQNVNKDLNFWIRGGFKITSKTDSILQTSGDLVVASKVTTIYSNKIYLGSSSSAEPMVLGKTLTDTLIALIDAFVNSASREVITSVGPGRLNPQIQVELKKLKAQLSKNSIISSDNFVANKNAAAPTPAPYVSIQ